MEVIAQKATADASGTAQVEIYAPGGFDLLITLTALSVTPSSPQPVALAYINGTVVEGSDTGANDSSDSRFVVGGLDRYRIVWTGAAAGAVCVATVVGWLYPPGQAPRG